jgi:hypothetical protein
MDLVEVKQLQPSSRSARPKRWKAEMQSPRIGRGDAVDILQRRELFEDRLGREVTGEWHQHQHPRHLRIIIELSNCSDQARFAGGSGHLYGPVLDVHLRKRADDRRTIGLRRAILPDEQGRQYRRSASYPYQLVLRSGNLGTKPPGECRTFQDPGGRRLVHDV